MDNASGESLAAIITDAVQRAQRGDMTISAAVALVPAEAIGAFLHATFSDNDDPALVTVLLTTALGASPGAAAGEIVFTAEDAIDAADAGRSVILVRNETTPDDVLGMQSARGILTTRGGITSHAAVVARGWGIPAVVGAGEVVLDSDGLHIGERVLRAGTEISIDGRTGEVFLGSAATATAEAPAELETLLEWADRIRAEADVPVAVRANADNSADAAHARHLGAEGIGLCRTEHMFLADDRLPLVRRFILTDVPHEEQAALADLEAAQQVDFEGILTAMDGLPITVRLLDPPLHEFLPELERLVVADALGELDDEGRVELAAVRRLHEVNPMIGTRGVRLGVVKPGLYQMQVRALLRAVSAVLAQGRSPRVEVMIPLVIDPTEMHMARSWVAEATAAVGFDGDVSVGAMLETPRAALVASELAEVSDFFSFGTNDLTQLMFAFSRDDVGSKLIPEYLRHGLLERDPFESLDQIGVGRLIRHACEHARHTNAAIKIGVCGEQAGDPESAKFLVACGVDYVSCSPYRVPIARLAVAQALLEMGRVHDDVLAAIALEAASASATQPEAAARDHLASAADTSHARTHDDEIDAEFLVMHALRIKGYAAADAVADISGIELIMVQDVLTGMAASGWCRHIAARDLWQLSPAGRDRHGEKLHEVSGVAVDGLRQPYPRFLDLNVGFKDLCNRWQMRDGKPNDHADPAYDGACIAELRALHEASLTPIAGFTAAIPRFGSYERRLSTSLVRLEQGEHRMFTGVMCGSYHDVWMELHEDLVQLLGVDRHAEGSY
ncbi:MAG: putative PEP-binding protein [Ilumatobacteraceae bacterium]